MTMVQRFVKERNDALFSLDRKKIEAYMIKYGETGLTGMPDELFWASVYKAICNIMVFVGNINQSVDVLLKTSSLFDPFPPEMGTDTAFLDRMHCYIPGWEIPKFRPEHFTDDYGFITDYLAEFLRELRKEQYGDALDRFYRLGKNLNQRDTIAVRKMVGGLVKLVYPDGVFEKEDLEEILQIALEMRRRVKEQLKKLGGMEFYDVNFSYIDNESFEEHYVSVPEQGGGKLIPEGMCNPGQVYTVSRGKSGMIGVFRLESQMLPGNGKFERTGIGSDRDAREATNTAFNFLKATIGIITFVYNFAIVHYGFGEIGLAAYLVIGYLMLIILTLFLGMAQGLQPVFSYFMGTGEEKRSKSLLGFSIKAFLAIGVLCYVLIVFFSRGFFTIFNPGDIELINFMESKSLPYFSGFFLAGFNILMISYWQANGRTSNALTVSLCRSVIWPPILVAVLPLIFGSEAVWLCHSISEIMTAIIAVVLIVFIKRKKENQKVGF